MISGHVDKVLITTTLGSRGLEKKIVVYISPEVISEIYLCLIAQSSLQNMGDFLAIVKEKNFIEVVSRSINQVDKLDYSSRKKGSLSKVIIITVDDTKAGSLNPASVIDSLESVESMAWPNPVPERCFQFWTINCTTLKKQNN